MANRDLFLDSKFVVKGKSISTYLNVANNAFNILKFRRRQVFEKLSLIFCCVFRLEYLCYFQNMIVYGKQILW